MARLSPFGIATIVTWLAVAAYALWAGVSYFLTGMYFPLESERASPDGTMTIYQFQTLQEGMGHAVYGDTLVLGRHRRIHEPDEGYVFFAGYCVAPVQYEWKSNTRVSVHCQRDPNTKVRTLASLMYGIEIEFSDR